MKVALVYDRVNKFGGAERVLRYLHQLYPEAPLFTLVYDPDSASWSKGIKVIPTFFNKVGFLRRHHEILAPVAALAFETFDLDQYDLVISVTSAEAKSVITKPNTLHICYCLTPTRYFWSGVADYAKQIKPRFLYNWYLGHAQKSDLVYAARPDRYLAISKEIAGRISNYYHQASQVVYPPVNYDFFSKTHRHKKGDYYLVVSRLVPYKKTDLVIKAFNDLDLPLIVVGTGSEEGKLKALAKDNIDFLGFVDDVKLRRLYAGAKALIFPQIEDFGLTPLEAAAAGTPTIAYKAAGASETILDKFTGLLFNEQTTDAIVRSVRFFETGHHQISPKLCREQAAKFSPARFKEEFSAKVNSIWQEHQKTFMS